MVRLGHIEFSNCFPVHAMLLDCGVPPWVRLCTGMPSDLNRWLASGKVDVAPASSIEYARSAGGYRVLPGLVIGSRGAVRSILLESRVPVAELHGREIAVPTASATSVVLLRLLLERRLGIVPSYRWFDQAADPEPYAADTAASLWIGDVALARAERATGETLLDLGEAWTDWTGLPFGFALWQTSAGRERDEDLRRLHGLLLESRAYFEANVDALAERHARRFGQAADRLREYWLSLEFGLDDAMGRGLLHFYRLAAELGETPSVEEIHWL